MLSAVVRVSRLYEVVEAVEVMRAEGRRERERLDATTHPLLPLTAQGHAQSTYSDPLGTPALLPAFPSPSSSSLFRERSTVVPCSAHIE
jgi:hypothetical protein